MIAYKIAFSGAHSTGKTTAFESVQSYLKERGLKVYPIQGVARSCPFPLNKEGTPEGQKWIFHKQALLEEEAYGKILESKNDGVILCERSIFDNLIYTAYLEQHDHFDQKWSFNKYFTLLARNMTRYPPYTLLIRTKPWPNTAVVFDGVRDQDPQYRNTIHTMFNSFFNNELERKIFGPYINLVMDPDSVEERLSEIDSYFFAANNFTDLNEV
jgi:thymidylate kinase